MSSRASPLEPAPPATAAAAPPRDLHARSFKLRFAAQREPGRSNVSLVKPLGLRQFIHFPLAIIRVNAPL